MSSPLSLVVANIYMEHFEERAINTSPIKPKHWKRYVDDTSFIWTHGKETLRDFLEHLNNQTESIKFTMEIEEDKKLPFLDVLLTKKMMKLWNIKCTGRKHTWENMFKKILTITHPIR